MDKHPTPPPHDAAFLAERDPAKIREWVTSYLTAVVEWSSDDDLLHAFETVSDSPVPRALSRCAGRSRRASPAVAATGSGGCPAPRVRRARTTRRRSPRRWLPAAR